MTRTADKFIETVNQFNLNLMYKNKISNIFVNNKTGFEIYNL